MQGVLIVAHGSRQKKTEDTMNAVVEMAKAKLPDMAISCGYMEFSPRNIAFCLGELVDQGVTEIVVVPYFLFDGIHIHEDIPGEIEAFVQANPGIRVRMGSTLGADPRLADILADRVRESL